MTTPGMATPDRAEPDTPDLDPDSDPDSDLESNPEPDPAPAAIPSCARRSPRSPAPARRSRRTGFPPRRANVCWPPSPNATCCPPPSSSNSACCCPPCPRSRPPLNPSRTNARRPSAPRTSGCGRLPVPARGPHGEEAGAGVGAASPSNPCCPWTSWALTSCCRSCRRRGPEPNRAEPDRPSRTGPDRPNHHGPPAQPPGIPDDPLRGRIAAAGPSAAPDRPPLEAAGRPAGGLRPHRPRAACCRTIHSRTPTTNLLLQKVKPGPPVRRSSQCNRPDTPRINPPSANPRSVLRECVECFPAIPAPDSEIPHPRPDETTPTSVPRRERWYSP